MSSTDRGDEVYQPTGDPQEQQDTAGFDYENILEHDYDDILDEAYFPPEHPMGAGRVGETAAEQRAGETLDQRLAQERPDIRPVRGDGIGDLPDGEGEPVDPQAGDRPAGRLVAPSADTGRHRGQDLVAAETGADTEPAGAEDAAMHVVPSGRDAAGGGAGAG